MSAPSFILAYSLKDRTVTCHYYTPSAPSVLQVSHLSLSQRSGNDTFWKWISRGSSELRKRLQVTGMGSTGPGVNRSKADRELFARLEANRTGEKPATKPTETRWMGGWVGWWGYEMKEESLGGYDRLPEDPVNDQSGHVDACWAWCDRILQRDKEGNWNVCGILSQGEHQSEQNPSPSINNGDTPVDIEMVEWLESLGMRFGARPDEWEQWVQSARIAVEATASFESSSSLGKSSQMPTFKPKVKAEDYKAGIQKCRDAIFAGDSYELTLTTQFEASIDSSPAQSSLLDPLDYYSTLRARNPAPYSTYIHFPSFGTSILSSSPERFIRIDGQGRVEMKPIKGTRARVKCLCGTEKAGDCPGGGGQGCQDRCSDMDRQEGQDLSADKKERAENLMVSPSNRLECMHFWLTRGRLLRLSTSSGQTCSLAALLLLSRSPNSLHWKRIKPFTNWLRQSSANSKKGSVRLKQ